jgi:hypothetical protein
MLIKLCYVKIGWLVTGIGSLYFSSNEPIEGQAKCERGKGGEQEKKCIGKYAVRHSVFV